MRCIYRILREMLHAVFVIYGDEFVTAEERQASCATMTHFNALENFGDDIITRAGREAVHQIFRDYCSLAHEWNHVNNKKS